MGIADVIPGVSGGTIAFITGIYPQLLLAVNSINMGALKLLFGLEIQKFWIQIVYYGTLMFYFESFYRYEH